MSDFEVLDWVEDLKENYPGVSKVTIDDTNGGGHCGKCKGDHKCQS